MNFITQNLEWIVALVAVTIVLILFTPAAIKAAKRKRIENEIRAVIQDLKKYRGERVSLAAAITYLRVQDEARLENLLRVTRKLYELIRAGQINARKVSKLDREVDIIEKQLTLAEADEMVERLEEIIDDRDATKRRLRLNVPRND